MMKDSCRTAVTLGTQTLTQVYGVPLEVSERLRGHVPYSAGSFWKAEHGSGVTTDRVHIWTPIC